MQNFRQKICFRTEDSATIEKINHLLGKVEVQKVSSSQSKTRKTVLRSGHPSKRLHDAEVLRFEMEYFNRILRFDLVVWVGLMEPAESRELYRSARLTLRDVGFLVIEAPDENYPWDEPGRVVIDAGSGVPKQSKSILPEPPAGTSVSWMYVEE
jgi:hypothetical protein